MTYYFIYKDLVEKKAAGWVYLVKAKGTNRYKIGRSTEPIKRYQTLKRQSPYPLQVIESFYTLDAPVDENHLHVNFAQYRVHGEWFEFPPETNIKDFFQETNLERSKTNCEILMKFLSVAIEMSKAKLSEKQVNYLVKSTRVDLARNPLRWVQAAESFQLFFLEATDAGIEPASFILGFVGGISASEVEEDRHG